MTAEEKKIIEGCRAGKTEYQKILYDQYGPDIKAVCIRYAGNEEEGFDLFHDTFVFILTHFKEYDRITSLGGWLHRIAVNRSIDFYRRKALHETTPIGEYEESFASVGPAHSADVLTTQQILGFVNQLPVKQRMAFNLYEVDGYPEQEIVEMMGESATNVRTLISRAKKRLRDCIRQYLQNEEYEL